MANSELAQQVFGGLRVVEFCAGMAGQMAAMLMADNGAEVIKIEPPGGDATRKSPGFQMWNRGKKSIVLNLEEDSDASQARALALTADLVLTTMQHGHAVRCGLDYESLSRVRPELVHCSITGFGRASAHEGLHPYTEIVDAKCGRTSGNDLLSGALVSGRPIFVASPATAFGAAGLAVQAISAALFARQRSGLGQAVETSMLDGASATTMRLAFAREGDKVVAREASVSSLLGRGIALCFLTPVCKDGRYIQMCARQDLHFKNWLSALELGHLLDEPRFAKAPLGLQSADDLEELESRIRARMATRTQQEWIEIFSTQWDVGGDPFLTPEEFLQHPQMVLNGRIEKIRDPRLGEVTQIGPLVQFSETPSRIVACAPQPGQHQTELPTLLSAPGPRATSNSSVAVKEARSRLARPPLDGITVLDLGYFLAGPFGATLLAELGARVIKVEPLAGDPYRRAGLEIVHLLHGKESMPVDLKREAGREIVRRLIGSSDALLHSFRPGVAERLGVDYETVRKINPRLVYLYAASYGSKGPQSHRPAFHSTPHALCGGGILQAGRGNPPVDDSYPDPCAGMAAGMALAMGLLARERHGMGQYLETTMLTTSGYVHSEHLTKYDGAPELPALDGAQLGFHALRRLYKCRDGWLMLSVQSDSEWERFARAIGHAQWIADPRYRSGKARKDEDDSLASALGAVFGRQDAPHWEQLLSSADVPAAAVAASFQQFMLDNAVVVPAEHAGFGAYWRVKPRMRFSASASRQGAPCVVGEHALGLLRELNYNQNEIDHLLRERVVASV